MGQIKHERVAVLSNVQVGGGHFRIRLSCDRQYSRAVPGQFVMVRLTDRIEPLLPRPFSIHRLLKEKGSATAIELLYKVVGKGTHQLSLKQPGDFVDLTGPLGSGFEIPARVRKIYIAAGGIGVAPMIFLLAFLQEQKIDLAGVRVFLGAKSKADILCQKEFSRLGVEAHTTTDDGSAGDQCLVTDPLDGAVAENPPDVIYACGPLEMLTCVAGIADKHKVSCQFSSETMMACGMGACLGCAVASRKHPDAYLHACLDGPVFDTRELKI
jgi:dihydroorotate dehydrogenase electron transfer subunit